MKDTIIMNSPTNNIPPQGYKMTELGALPEEWKVVKLGEVADISSGGNAPQGDKYFNGDKPFVRVSHIDNQNYSVNKYDLINDNAINDYRLKLFPKDTIIFPKSGATVYLEKRAMLPIDAYVVSHLCTVISNKEKAIQHFLFYVLINLKLAKEKADGYPTLNISEVKQIPIPLPPLPEQQKIAAVLSAVQEAKEKTEDVIAAVKALKKSMMKHLFTYGPVSPQEAENVPLKETEIGPVPEDWEVVRLGEVADIVMGQSPPGSSYNETGVGLPFLQGKAEFGPLHPLHIKYTTTAIKIAPKDSVLLSVRAPVGDVNLANIDYCIGRGLASISLSSGKNIFLFYILTYLKNEIEKEGTGSIFKAINKTKLLNFKLPLPPLPIQQKIASILSAIDEKIEAEENKKKVLEELFKSLLHNLMTAKIRVNQLEVTS